MVLKEAINQADVGQMTKGLIGMMRKEHEMYPRTRKTHSPLVYRSHGQTRD